MIDKYYILKTIKNIAVLLAGLVVIIVIAFAGYYFSRPPGECESYERDVLADNPEHRGSIPLFDHRFTLSCSKVDGVCQCLSGKKRSRPTSAGCEVTEPETKLTCWDTTCAW